MTVCSITLSEDDGETEEEILADTKYGNSPATTTTPEPEAWKQSNSQKASVLTAQSLRARLASSTTNLLAKLVSTEKSISVWDATLDSCDIDMCTPVRRSTSGKSHSSSRKRPKHKIDEILTRRASETYCVAAKDLPKPEQNLALDARHIPKHDTDTCLGIQHLAPSDKVDAIWTRSKGEVDNGRKRQSVGEEVAVEGEGQQISREEEKAEEQQEKKVLFQTDLNTADCGTDIPGEVDMPEEAGSSAHSEDITEDREASQDGEGKVSLRTRRRGSSFRGLRDLTLRRFTLRSDTPGIRRTTLILFLISLVYIVSFLPHLVMMTLKALTPQAVDGDSPQWTVASNLIIRSYFLNSVANPVIYTFLSKNFLRRVRGSLSRWSRRR